MAFVVVRALRPTGTSTPFVGRSVPTPTLTSNFYLVFFALFDLRVLICTHKNTFLAIIKNKGAWMEAIRYENFQYFTYSDYIQWEESWELIDGIAYAMAPAPYPAHQKVVFRISKELDANLNCSDDLCEVYISPIDWKVNDTTVVQPDIVLFCEKTEHQYFSKTPPLIVEVLSKATALKDVTTKFDLYEKERVLYYVIVEPNTELTDIYKLIDGKYQHVKKLTKEDSFSFELSDECKTEVNLAKVFT